MTKKPTYEMLEKRIQQLERAAADRKKVEEDTAWDLIKHNRAEKINNVLFAISNAVNTTRHLKDLYPSIHQSLGQIIDVSNFFIALMDNKRQTLYFPYHVDTRDDDFDPITNFNINDSLTGLVFSRRTPLLLGEKDLKDRADQNGIMGPVPVIWMGVPLITKDQIIGVIAVQSYLNPHLYTEYDLQILSAVCDQVAMAIDRKRGEEKILRSEKRFREIIEGVSEISIQGYDEKRHAIFWNQASENLYGYTKQEVLGKKFEEILIPREMKEQAKNLHHRWFKYDEKIPPGERTLIDKNGNEVPVFSSHVMHNTRRGNEIFCIDINLKPLKQAQKEKIEAQKIADEQKKMALIGQIAGKMAHDFNNILGVIMGNTELSLMDCREEETRKTLELVFEQTVRGRNLTKNLVAFAKNQEPRCELFQLNEKIDMVINLLKNDLTGIQVIREDKSDRLNIVADPEMIEHALLNFLQNSIHAVSMVKAPKIIIKTYELDDNICFEIEDNGCGISPEHIEKIYDLSFTLKGSKDTNNSYKKDIKGTGYGLPNAKKYIKLHRGSIFVESKFCSGTKFIIHLPMPDKKTLHGKKTTTHIEKHILLVEDEPAISEIQYTILSQKPLNHKVDVAKDGEIAIDLFKKNQYDLVSLDYVLPGKINGMDIYNHIRKTDKTIPIVFISGNIEFLESINELKKHDPHIDHLPKPCQNKTYVNVINKLFEKTQAVQ
ncbi:MAG: response regulator [Desulfobacteraceae bacterium]|nr:response regulator [Desulfobacteraceae bacterium]